jgi:hypothetical protein
MANCGRGVVSSSSTSSSPNMTPSARYCLFGDEVWRGSVASGAKAVQPEAAMGYVCAVLGCLGEKE